MASASASASARNAQELRTLERCRTSMNPNPSNFELDGELPSSNITERELPSLPPTDHGKHAYLVLAGCTVIQTPVWGYSLAFGVFQEYYTTHRILEGSSNSVAIVGTTLTGLIYLMLPISFTFLTRYPHLRRYCGPLGLFVTVASLILSSYSTKVWHLIASQGVLCAIGSGLLYSPTTLYLDEWFIARKGLAYGTIGAGKSAAGVILPFITSSLLQKYGIRVTLQAWSVSLITITLPLLFFLKPRIPVSNSTNSATPRSPLSWSFLKSPTFWMLQFGNVVEAFGYLLPPTYIASYAHKIGLPSITGAVLIALLSLASVFGSLIHGILGDHLPLQTVILISTLGSAASVFLFWGLAKHVAVLAIFAIVYGFFAGGFSSTYPAILKEMKNVDEAVDNGVVMGMLLGGRGVGFVIGGGVSSALLGGGKGGWGYSSEYGGVILCTGVTAVLGGWGWIWMMGKRLLY